MPRYRIVQCGCVYFAAARRRFLWWSWWKWATYCDGQKMVFFDPGSVEAWCDDDARKFGPPHAVSARTYTPRIAP